jgi:transcriptional regulator with XRE-family HTH domain
VASARTPHTAPRSLADIWGESLTERREQLGLSRAQLARAAEMTSQAVWQFETGQRVPLDRTKVVLARALGTNPGELFPWPPMEDLVA